MPLTPKGKKMMAAMESEYGAKKGESVFYATMNKRHLNGMEGKPHMHSPARDVQAFNETFLGNAKVPQVGLVTGNPGTYTNPSATGTPAGVVKADGRANLGTTVTQHQAPPNSASPGGSRKFTPATVDTFTDSTV